MKLARGRYHIGHISIFIKHCYTWEQRKNLTEAFRESLVKRLVHISEVLTETILLLCNFEGWKEGTFKPWKSEGLIHSGDLIWTSSFFLCFEWSQTAKFQSDINSPKSSKAHHVPFFKKKSIHNVLNIK